MKKGRDAAGDLVKAVFKGGLRTARLFDRATGGCRLDQACEYLVTAGIFEQLAQRDRGTVLLEVPVRLANREARAIRCGAPSASDRRNGRYDLVHYWANGAPRAAIEVKSPIRNAVRSSFRGDLLRLSNTLSASINSTYQFGAFVFFATKDYSGQFSAMRGKVVDARERLGAMMASIDEIAADYTGDRLFHRLYTSKVYSSRDAEEGVWQLGMILLAGQGKQGTFPRDLITQ